MKFIQAILAAAFSAPVICQEQIRPAGFVPFAEQQQQAKTGVTSSVGNYGGNVVEAIADADPLRATVGAVAVEALRAAEDPVLLGIKINGNEDDNIPVRKVHVDSEGLMAATATNVDAVTGTTLVANLTFDNGSKNNDSVSNAVADGTATSTQINAKLATRKPSFSLQSLINALEDVAIDEGVRYEIIFDQNDNSGLGRVKVFQVDTEAHLASAHAATDATALADFEVDTTPTSVSEKLAGE